MRISSQIWRQRQSSDAFTIVEVVIATGLVVFALASIYAMQSQSLQIARAAHDSGSASQILQQRVEQLRLNKFPDVVRSTGLVNLMSEATDSEADLRGVRSLTETVRLTSSDGTSVFSVTRRGGAATSSATLDLGSQSQVRAFLQVSWTDRTGTHRREFSTILGKGGISFDGISRTAETEGTVGTPSSSTPPPASTPPSSTPPPSPPGPEPVCVRHGRPQPHCGT